MIVLIFFTSFIAFLESGMMDIVAPLSTFTFCLKFVKHLSIVQL